MAKPLPENSNNFNENARLLNEEFQRKQEEIESLRAQLAKANERVKELERQMDILEYYNGDIKATIDRFLPEFATEKQAQALDAVKDKWIKKASEMPLQLECRSKGSSCYNWAMYYARELKDEAEKLRKGLK